MSTGGDSGAGQSVGGNAEPAVEGGAWSRPITMEVRFDDIEQLRTYISDDFGDWGPEVTITQPMIDRFADLTDDHQWIHVDVEHARNGPFGTTIAHGFLTLALMPLYRPSLPIQVVGEKNRVNYGADSYRLLAPVAVDRTIHARIRLADVRLRPQGTLLCHEMMVAAVGSERPAVQYKGLLLYMP